MTSQQKQDPQQLLMSTLHRLQDGIERVSPAGDLIDQWSQALGEGNQTLENIADELYALKRSLAEGRSPQIAGSLHTLSKLTKQAANESSDVGLVGQLNQLAEILDDASARIAQSR
jgi:ABC-type transporter Mla subunit MlaD